MLSRIDDQPLGGQSNGSLKVIQHAAGALFRNNFILFGCEIADFMDKTQWKLVQSRVSGSRTG